jgi:hypothetical protein
MDNSTLNRTNNWWRAVGIVSELALIRENCEIKIKDANGAIGTVPGERIRGKVAIDIGGGIKTFDVFAQSLTSKGEANKQWAMYEAMMNWNPKIGGDAEKEPAKVGVEGTISINDYVGGDGKVKSTLRWNVSKGNTKVSEDEPLGCSLKLTGFIRKILPEMRNEEETGRLKIELLGVDGQGAVYPIDLLVDADSADDFEGVYEIGKTAAFDVDVKMVHVGEKKPTKKAFGKSASTNINTGFDVEERVLVGGDEPIEEPEGEDEEGNLVDNGWLNPEAIKAAIKERDKKLAELEKNPPKKATETASASAKNSSKFNKKPDMNSTDDDDDFGF